MLVLGLLVVAAFVVVVLVNVHFSGCHFDITVITLVSYV